MALEEFEKEQLSERHKGLVRMRSITNYGMGIFIVLAGCVFIFPTSYTREFLNRYDSLLIKLLGAVCWVYGAFRIYRGYKKNYFRD